MVGVGQMGFEPQTLDTTKDVITTGLSLEP